MRRLQAELETALAKKEALQRTEVLRATQLAEASVDAEAKVQWAVGLGWVPSLCSQQQPADGRTPLATRRGTQVPA